MYNYNSCPTGHAFTGNMPNEKFPIGNVPTMTTHQAYVLTGDSPAGDGHTRESMRRPTGPSRTIYYVHSDILNIPQLHYAIMKIVQKCPKTRNFRCFGGYF